MDVGYLFTPFTDSMALGYAALDVALTEHGRAEGFCPAQIRLQIWDGEAISRTDVSHLTPGPATQQVMPGMVTVVGHNGAMLNLYTFGATLTSRTGGNSGDVTLCRLTSPAPILNLSEEGLDSAESAVLRVVDGFEAALATERAAHNADQELDFDARLAQADPRRLYAVALTLAQHSFATLPELLRTEHYWDEYAILNRAVDEASRADWWPADPALAAATAPASPPA